MDQNHSIPDYKVGFDTYFLMPTKDLFKLIVTYNKKAIECVNPKSGNFYPNHLLIYLDQISIIKDVLILNKPISELKELKEDLEFWLSRYIEGTKTVSQETKEEMQEVMEHVKGELEEASKYLAEAISLRK